jgi:hypothetical protein
MRLTGELRSGSSTTTAAVRTETPVDRIAEVGEITPLTEQFESAYDKRKERIRHRDWRVDKTLAEHHRRVLELAKKTTIKKLKRRL